MSTTWWLVGVRASELAARRGHRFFGEIELQYAGLPEARRSPSIVRKVSAPWDVRPLQTKHGEEFIEFFYVTPALLRAAEDLGIPVNRLGPLVFGVPPGTEIFSVIPIPAEYVEP